MEISPMNYKENKDKPKNFFESLYISVEDI